jgi:hypothetical protein
MGKIQAGHVHTQAQQIAHRGLGMAGWADGADNLGAARSEDTGGHRGCRGTLYGEKVFCSEMWLAFFQWVLDRSCSSEEETIVLVETFLIRASQWRDVPWKFLPRIKDRQILPFLQCDLFWWRAYTLG